MKDLQAEAHQSTHGDVLMDPRKKAETAQRETNPIREKNLPGQELIDATNGRCRLDKRLSQAEACHREIIRLAGGKGADTRSARVQLTLRPQLSKQRGFPEPGDSGKTP